MNYSINTYAEVNMSTVYWKLLEVENFSVIELTASCWKTFVVK